MDSETVQDVEQPASQRVKKALNLAERIEVIREYDITPNTRYLARKFGCGRTQIQNILRHRQEYLSEWDNNGNPYRIRRRQSVQLLTLGAIVYEWTQRCRTQSCLITDDLIRQTGQRVAKILDIPDFRPTNRWLERLKNKYKLFDLEQQDLTRCENVTGNKSMHLEDIIADLRDPQAENNFLPVPKIKQFEGTSLNNGVCKLNSEKNTSTPITDLDQQMKINPDHVFSECFRFDASENDVSLLNVESAGNPEAYEGVNRKLATGISSYKEAINYLGPLEQFALMSEDIRAIGLINQLENILREKMQYK